MTAELKPDFVFIAAAVKSILLFLEIVDVDAKLLAIVEYRSARAALAGHAGKIIERAQLPYNATAFAFAPDKRRNITLDPKIRLWIPETDMLQDQSLTVRVRFAAVRDPDRFGRPYGKLPLHRRLFRIHTFGHTLLRRHAHAQALVCARRAVRDRRRNEDDFAGLVFNDARFAFDLRTAAKLQIDHVMVRRARELFFASGHMFNSDPQTVALEDRNSRAIAGKRRASKQIEWANSRDHSLPHACGADDRAFVPFHPDMLRRLPVRHELAYFLSHLVLLLIKRIDE